MVWVYSKGEASVIVKSNRSISFNNYYVLKFGMITNNIENEKFRETLLPFYVDANFKNWAYESVNGKIDNWVVKTLTGWWCRIGVFGYRFQNESDAVMFKLTWG